MISHTISTTLCALKCTILLPGMSAHPPQSHQHYLVSPATNACMVHSVYILVVTGLSSEDYSISFYAVLYIAMMLTEMHCIILTAG